MIRRSLLVGASALSAIPQLALLLLTHSHTAQAQNPTNPTWNPPPPSNGAIPAAKNASEGFNPQLTSLLGDALWFYDAQRSGQLPTNFRVPWRNNSCQDDGSANGVDLSGGFYDAGDYIKATYPLCWTLISLSWSALSFGNGYERSGQAAYLDSILRWGYDYLIKAHPDNSTLWVLVGDPNKDNQYWGGDQNIPKPRPSFKIDSDHPGTDAFASCAGAFAAASYLYGHQNASLPVQPSGSASLGGVSSIYSQSYSQTLLYHAEALWNVATTSKVKQVYQKVVRQAGESYPSSGYQDDLVMAALWLSIATGEKSYADAAQAYYLNATRPSYPFLGSALNWDNKASALPVLARQLIELNSNLGLNQTRFQNDAEAWLDQLVAGTSSNVISTPAGLLYWNSGDSDEASLNPALNAAFLADLYSGLASTPTKTAQYQNLSKSQVDYVLGSNPYNGPFVVGLHPNSPTNPHSALAAGGDYPTNINYSPPDERYILYGALVGGPDKQDRYFDILDDWPQTEIALDYNAPLVAAAVSRISRNQIQDPVFVTLTGPSQPADGVPTDAAYPPHKHSANLSTGAQIGIAVAVVVVVFSAAGGLAWWQRARIRWYYRQKRLGLQK